jgi:hypothetical protein
MTSYTTFYTTINDLFEGFGKWVPWTTKDTPGTLANLWTSTRGTKGTIVVVIVASVFWKVLKRADITGL